MHFHHAFFCMSHSWCCFLFAYHEWSFCFIVYKTWALVFEVFHLCCISTESKEALFAEISTPSYAACFPEAFVSPQALRKERRKGRIYCQMSTAATMETRHHLPHPRHWRVCSTPHYSCDAVGVSRRFAVIFERVKIAAPLTVKRVCGVFCSRKLSLTFFLTNFVVAMNQRCRPSTTAVHWLAIILRHMPS